jgi:predicted RNase H-like HicB family nuclease
VLTTGRKDMHQLSVVIEKDEFGYYAYCPAPEGCQTQGDSMEEVQNNIREAVTLYLKTSNLNGHQNLLELIEDEGLYRAMGEVRDEVPISRAEALKALEVDEG